MKKYIYIVKSKQLNGNNYHKEGFILIIMKFLQAA